MIDPTLAAVLVTCLLVVAVQVPITLYFRRQAYKAGHADGYAVGLVRGRNESTAYWAGMESAVVQSYTELTKEKVRKERKQA